MDNHIICDIETSALPLEQLEKIMPVFEPSKVLKDPEKIAADVAKKKQEWIEEAALRADRGYVLAVGLLNEKGALSVLEGDEPMILGALWKIWEGTTCTVIGHCIKTFDIPFLIRRSWINGIKIPTGIIRGRYITERVIDTMETWGCGVYGERISLNSLSQSFGLPGKSGSGKDFASNYLKGGLHKSNALLYLKDDLELTQKSAKSMGLI